MRLKKKEEAKPEAKPEAKADDTAMEVEGKSEGETPSTETTGEEKTETGAVSVLGIGGRRIQPGGGKKPTKKRTPGEIRIQKGKKLALFLILVAWTHFSRIFVSLIDIADLDGGKVAQVDFPNPNDLTLFTVAIAPDSGFWVGATYNFSFVIPASYPHEPPKVTCKNKIYHPNINLEGNVCLNILREDWKPVLDINAVIYGLIYLFYDPNPDDPLNREAADLYRNDRAQVSTKSISLGLT